MNSSNLRRLVILATTVHCSAACLSAQTTFTAATLALRSSGAAAGTDWTLNANGYLGTYITLASPGVVNFDISASGVADGGVAPRMSLAVADSRSSFDVSGGFNNYSQSISLPAGTHFVRLQYDNDVSSAAGRALTFRNLQVTGATVSNNATNANALAASNTYIDHYRKGDVSVTLTGPGGIPLLQGTNVHTKMVRNAFNFGGTVSGSSNNDSKDMLQSNPAVGTEAYKFQQFINRNFNTIVPSNAGKWSNNEATQNNVNMTLVDKQLNYAMAHNMKSRMHTLIWGSGATSGSQQPTWVNTLITSAAGGNATSKTNLSNAIASRINYYAGTNGNRSMKYIEIDGLNESLHNPSYWNIYGASGMANVYNQIQSALNATGSEAKIYVNEWNVIQFSPNTISATGAGTGSDLYANWYRAHVDSLREAGGAVSGVGVQYYANLTQTGSNAHSAATIEKALQNLSITGLPISMAEFGMASGTSQANSQTLGPAVLEDTMRMFYGNPQATSFMVWGWWDVSTAGTPYPPAAMLDNTQGNNVLTPIGTKWEQLMTAWRTDVNAVVDENGAIVFNGYFGDYNIGDQSGFSNLTHEKGVNSQSLLLAAPPDWYFWKPANSGTWSTAANWSTAIADGIGHTAHFAQATAARNVTLNTDIVLGQINFDSTSAYSVDGTGAVTLDAIAGPAALNVVRGQHTISAQIALANDTRVWIAPADSSLTITRPIEAAGKSLTKFGNGTLNLARVTLQSLLVSEGRVALLDGVGTSLVASLAVDSGASLDVNRAILVVDYTGESPIQSLTQRVITARSGGTWQGAGITSLIAAADTKYALAIAEAAWLANGGTFSGVPTDSSAIILRATLHGDATMDGIVDFDDLLTLAQNYESGTNKNWAQGDSNYDGVVDFDDLLALAQNYGQSASGEWNPSLHFRADWILALSIVPEPLPLSGAMTLMLMRRSR